MFTTGINDATWGKASRRTWATLTSFAVQAMGLAILLLLPLIYTQGLPQLKRLSPLLIATPAPPPGPPPKMATAHADRMMVSNLRDGRLMLPGSIPHAIVPVDDQGVTPSSTTAWVPGGSASGADSNGVLHSILSATGLRPALPKPAISPHNVLRSSVMMQGYLVHRVEPPYPPLAKAARIQGAVQLRAMISKQGTIKNLQVLSGHPMLAGAAVEAVRQWRYRPYVLNGEAVEVETEVTVNFVLSGG
jgi:periplasmic protein TonB